MFNMVKKNKFKILIVLIVVVLLIILYVLYQTVYLDYVSTIDFKLIGNDEVTLEVFSIYEEKGTKATFRGNNITKMAKVNGNVDTSKVGNYSLKYEIEYKNKKSSLKRTIKVVDTESPAMTLLGEAKYSIYIGETFNDPGVQVFDNYDGDITSNVAVENNINNMAEGVYSINYTSTDSSGNVSTISREVEVKTKPIISQGIAVLNYHFFYSDGEYCNQSICINTNKFEEQLKYLNDNGYKTLTMDEFVDWMYGRIELPKKSVLITIDDGAMGTGFHNGNKLIPLLEKYQVHATLFLITGWWDINNYRSDYLEVESHSYDMHTEGLCSNVTRGAKMLCLDHDSVLADLKKSISITGSSDAFCYPFYAYNSDAINLVKEAGFKVAFAGGGIKATRNSNKYAIPRYPIYSSTSLSTFINYIS